MSSRDIYQELNHHSQQASYSNRLAYSPLSSSRRNQTSFSVTELKSNQPNSEPGDLQCIVPKQVIISQLITLCLWMSRLLSAALRSALWHAGCTTLGLPDTGVFVPGNKHFLMSAEAETLLGKVHGYKMPQCPARSFLRWQVETYWSFGRYSDYHLVFLCLC